MKQQVYPHLTMHAAVDVFGPLQFGHSLFAPTILAFSSVTCYILAHVQKLIFVITYLLTAIRKRRSHTHSHAATIIIISDIG